ncbi:ABC transporter substrate-binding protein [Paenibacillus sacheonensis]|uniref:Extracellular solute-binding protein n=1 Tax=Paenibacillus sacheonensis TaxID=742054 RepID=A0A7X5C0J6_9BACL|nr:extracellular solute-binding protein [Paenibacillus sacheonensis]MBM7568353.1 ABC-type glycerol-3-phosphate transport system substrate-binding protein [Paenibacillus sacheonensis]NBC68464.1 extracellular solute-binding protein [Paenibacillus sacheonensis]
MQNKKVIAILTTAVLSTTLLAACGSNNNDPNTNTPANTANDQPANTNNSTDAPANDGGNKADDTPKENKTITFSTITNYYTAGLEIAAEDYHKLHPETTVKIDIVSDNTTYQTSFQAKMAAGGDDAPDIVHANLLGDTPNNNIAKGFILKLNDFIEQPNPYNNGTSLKDGIVADYWKNATDSANEVYMLPFDLVGTGFFYNKDIFSKAGITEAPTTWEALFDALQKIKDAGTIPLAMSQATGSDYEGWMVGAFLDWSSRSLIPDTWLQPGDARDTPEADKINSTLKYSPDDPFFDVGAVGDVERQLALWKSGKYDATGPAEQKTWTTLKKLSTYLQPGYATMKDADAYQLFISGKAAAYWNGSWQVGQILKDQKSLGDKAFQWGTFKFPDFATPDPNFPGHPRGILVPGHQLSVTAKKDQETVARSKDFLQFLYSPAEAQKVFSATIDAGQFVQGPSLVKGVTLPDEINAYLDGFKVAGNMAPISLLTGGNPAAEPNATAEGKSLELQYYNDKISLDEYLKKRAALAKKTNEQYIADNKYDLDPKTNP